MKLHLFLLLLAAHAHAADAGPAPATLTKEADLLVLTLKPEAEARLRLKTVALEKQTLPAVRIFSGEVVQSLATAGQTVAPILGGTLDEVLKLADLQAAADGKVLLAQVQVDAAKVAMDRAKKVLQAEAGSLRSVDEATATLAMAEAANTTAKAQRALLGKNVNDTAEPTYWLRVAIYSGEAASLNPKAPASIREVPQGLQPVVGPRTANTAMQTVDWFYAIPPVASLRSGSRVAVQIPVTTSQEERIVAPFSAVLHDINGGQWVYEQTSEHTYTRRRVQVERLSGGLAVLSKSPAVGTKVVTDGATELFGTEFMTGK